MNEPRNTEIMRLVAEGMSYAEIAKKLGLTRSLVAGVVFRWRRKLARDAHVA